MTFDEFVENYNGQAIDYDGGAGVQCLDLAKLYMDKVLGITPRNIGNAEAYWNRFDEIPELRNNFSHIPNDDSYFPEKRRFSCLG